MSTDHSPILFSFSKNPDTPFIDYTAKLKNHIKIIQKKTLKENITGEQMIWEYIKNEIRKFSINFSKQYAKDKRTKTFILEKKKKRIRGKRNL